jgi:hypothetical protein
LRRRTRRPRPQLCSGADGEDLVVRDRDPRVGNHLVVDSASTSGPARVMKVSPGSTLLSWYDRLSTFIIKNVVY